jgi:CcmD family protein
MNNISATLKKTIFSLLMIFLATGAFAQEASLPPVDMATGLYQSGKIYVVVIVLSVIMAGILGYLIMLDRKVSKLEKEQSGERNSEFIDK